MKDADLSGIGSGISADILRDGVITRLDEFGVEVPLLCLRNCHCGDCKYSYTCDKYLIMCSIR